MKDFIIETNRLFIRDFSLNEEDLNNLYSLHANEEVAKNTIDGVQTLSQVKNSLQDFVDHKKKFGFSQMSVFNKNGEFLGRAGLTKRKLNKKIGENAEIRFAILPKFWGGGYASEITKALIDYGFNILKLPKIIAINGFENAASNKVLIKNGFEFRQKIIAQGYEQIKNLEIRFYEIKNPNN
jgi:RimJ/RimL family protein N-acetyltransferase